MRNETKRELILTSRRLRGEVAALFARRVRGQARRSTHPMYARDGGSPLPRKKPGHSGTVILRSGHLAAPRRMVFAAILRDARKGRAPEDDGRGSFTGSRAGRGSAQCLSLRLSHAVL